jgi:hypothetical protein
MGVSGPAVAALDRVVARDSRRVEDAGAEVVEEAVGLAAGVWEPATPRTPNLRLTWLSKRLRINLVSFLPTTS